MESPKRVFLAILGVGGVGSAFLTQLATLSERLSHRPRQPVELCLVYVGRSTTCLLADPTNPIYLDGRQSDLANNSSSRPPLPLNELAGFLSKLPGPAVLVDTTSSQQTAEAYPNFLRSGTHIVTPNKKAWSSTLALWNSIFDVASNYGGNAIPGAGSLFFGPAIHPRIPIVRALKDIQDSGDRVTRIEGVFSGTMSLLFNNFSPAAVTSGSTIVGGAFSAELKMAKDLGYTESDPREDLSGTDVARKLTTIARLCGLPLASVDAVKTQSLVPVPLRDITIADGDQFVARMAEFDAEWAEMRRLAEQEHKVLRYVGSIDIEKAEVRAGVRKQSMTHPFATLQGSDNIISIYSHRFGDDPFIMQGGASGGELTAAGVIGDLHKVIDLIL